MRSPAWLVLVIIGTSAFAQPQLPQFLPQDTVSMPCPWDSTQTIFTYAGWEAYQTLNGLWDGPKDSTICMDLAFQQGQWVTPRISFDQCDPARPVFVRALLDSLSAVPLDSNTLYVVDAEMAPSSWTALDTTGGCQQGLCTGLQIAVRVPDSTGMGHVLRWYQGSYSTATWNTIIRVCMPTERFTTNAMGELIYKISPTGNTTGQYVNLTAAQAVDWSVQGLVKLDSTELTNHQSGPITYALDGWGWDNFLVMYTDTTYPSPPHLSYLDVYPVPNTAAPTTVTVEVLPYAGLVFQPFTQFRAGTVLNSDSVRHALTLINAGGDVCLGFDIVELIFEPNDRYVHEAGHLDFQGARSCFLFKRGSTLEVAPGSTLHYGVGNRGMLALNAGCDVRIGSGGELRVYGTLVLTEGRGATVPQDLITTLGPGAKLSFAPGAKVLNAYSMNGDMRWVICSDGGEVDLSGLSGTDREKIVVIDLPQEALTELAVLPSGDQVLVSFASRAAGSGNLRCFDPVGRCVYDRALTVQAGTDQVLIPAVGWSSGAYLVVLQVDGERRAGRWVRP